MDDSAVGDLVGNLYEASYDRTRWQSYLENLRARTDAMTASLICTDLTGAGVDVEGMEVPLVPAEANQLYRDHYHKHDEFSRALARRGIGPGRTWSSDQLIADDELAATEFHNGWLRPFDYFYTAGGILFQNGTAIVGLAILRSRRQGPPTDETVRLLTALMPHHQRAVLIEQRLRRLEATGGLNGRLADALPYGLIALDRRGCVLTMNRMAAKIADARDGLTVGPDGLAALRPRDDGVLRRAIAAALAPVPAGDTVALPRPSSLHPLHLIVTPVPRDEGPLRALDTFVPAALVFVHDAERRSLAPVDMLQRLYGLTPRQARLTALLAGGATVGDSAEALGIARETAVSHLKQVFLKTGVHRQADLIRLLLSLPPGGNSDAD